MMEITKPNINLNKGKHLFILASLMGFTCLVGTAGRALQKLEVYKQEKQVYIITEQDTYVPFGFNKKKAVKVAEIQEAYTIEKSVILLAGILLASVAIWLGEDVLVRSAFSDELKQASTEAEQGLIKERLQYYYGMMSKEQQLRMRRDLKFMFEAYEEMYDELDAEENLQGGDQFLECLYAFQASQNLDKAVTQVWGSEAGTPEHAQYKQKFQDYYRNELETRVNGNESK